MDKGNGSNYFIQRGIAYMKRRRRYILRCVTNMLYAIAYKKWQHYKNTSLHCVKEIVRKIKGSRHFIYLMALCVNETEHY